MRQSAFTDCTVILQIMTSSALRPWSRWGRKKKPQEEAQRKNPSPSDGRATHVTCIKQRLAITKYWTIHVNVNAVWHKSRETWQPVHLLTQISGKFTFHCHDVEQMSWNRVNSDMSRGCLTYTWRKWWETWSNSCIWKENSTNSPFS